MAGDWIKLRKELYHHPKVMRIASQSGLCEEAIVGWLGKLWCWADDVTTNGHVDSVTHADVERVTGVPHKVLAAIQSVGWFMQTTDGICFPDFEKHMSESAKKRALSGKRQRKRRHASVTQVSRSKRDNSVTREEKRREEKIKETTTSSSKEKADDDDDDGKEFSEEDWRIVREWANRIRRAKSSLDRDWVWQMLVLAATVERGVPGDIGEAIVSGHASKPRQYAEKVLRDYLGINTPELRARLAAIPVPAAKAEVSDELRQT